MRQGFNKENMSSVCILVLGILVVGLLIFDIYSFVGNRIPDIHSEYTVSEKENQEEEKTEEKIIEKSHEGFSANSNKTRVVEVEKEEDESDYGDYSNQIICEKTEYELIDFDDIEEAQNGTYEDLPVNVPIIQMMINEIYARYGYVFDEKTLQDYFDRQKWYQNIDYRNDDSEEIYNMMSNIERDNVDFLTKYL